MHPNYSLKILTIWLNNRIIAAMSDQSTEEKIKDAAHEVFVQKGMAGARMQEIADKAGINKALLHYYYRSKELLFNAVFETILSKFVPKLFEVVNSDLPLEVKVYQVAEKYTKLLKKHRDLPIFILNELQRHPDRFASKIGAGRNIFAGLERQLEEEYQKGNIRQISVEMFMMNTISMLVFPFAAQPMFQLVTEMDQKKYEDFLEERKTEVPKFIMNALKL